MLGVLWPAVVKTVVLPALGAVTGWKSGEGRPASVTLKRMADVVGMEVEKPAVFELATRIVAEVDGRDYLGQARAVMEWLREHTRFVRDPVSEELLRTPTYMIYLVERDGYAQGDCDDIAMLAAALMQAIGFRAWFIAEGYQGGPRAPLAHVFTVVETQAGPRRLDTQVMPEELPRRPARRIAYEV